MFDASQPISLVAKVFFSLFQRQWTGSINNNFDLFLEAAAIKDSTTQGTITCKPKVSNVLLDDDLV